MIQILLVIILSSSAFAVLNDAGGNGMGNGGDAITCSASPDNFLNGTYSLDYILTLQNAQADEDSVEVKSWEDSAERLNKLFINKIPSLATYFQEYRSMVFNTDYKLKHVWEPAPFGLVDIKDEYIEGRIPRNCLTDGTVKVVQAVIRPFKDVAGIYDTIIYNYVPKVTDELNKSNPLQLSYLLVHEWLWDISGNVERNRRLNHFFHSKKIDGMTQAEVEAELKGMGLRLPRVEPDDFASNSCQGRRLTKQQVTKRFFSDGGSFTHELASAEAQARRRIVICDKRSPNCDKSWGEASGKLSSINAHPSKAAITNARDFSQPLVVVYSPGFMREFENKNYRDGDGQIKCAFDEKPDSNLICYIDHPFWYSDLTGLYLDRPFGRGAPPLRGLITEECLRITATYPLQEIGEQDEIQAVISARFRWRE